MADNSPRALVCLSEGGSKPFRVELAGNKDMIDLKDLIKEKRHVRVLAKRPDLVEGEDDIDSVSFRHYG